VATEKNQTTKGDYHVRNKETRIQNRSRRSQRRSLGKSRQRRHDLSLSYLRAFLQGRRRVQEFSELLHRERSRESGAMHLRRQSLECLAEPEIVRLAAP